MTTPTRPNMPDSTVSMPTLSHSVRTDTGDSISSPLTPYSAAPTSASPVVLKERAEMIKVHLSAATPQSTFDFDDDEEGRRKGGKEKVRAKLTGLFERGERKSSAEGKSRKNSEAHPKSSRKGSIAQSRKGSLAQGGKSRKNSAAVPEYGRTFSEPFGGGSMDLMPAGFGGNAVNAVNGNHRKEKKKEKKQSLDSSRTAGGKVITHVGAAGVRDDRPVEVVGSSGVTVGSTGRAPRAVSQPEMSMAGLLPVKKKMAVVEVPPEVEVVDDGMANAF
ncbi:hypothetical protein BJ508DRAFT_364115 [Ascobolus immersus RN42]|uniref:Uncharacterized protein n=1 Tax=Ascobolus immersus RN42 TaxID=1160509 RepID=A0A3N4HVW3_ASCIM|nr:hypothetical protein BJ508DRAFT_364115 [Ascobolus immersus RN42]